MTPAPVRSFAAPRRKGPVSLEESIGNRRSVRSFSGRPLSESELSQVLWAVQGMTQADQGFRSAPSAGAIYPLETRAVIPDGIFRYEPRDHALTETRTGDFRKDLAGAALDQMWMSRAGLIIALSAVPHRMTGRYGSRAERYMNMEAGHAAQNVHLQAVAIGLASAAVGAFDDERVSAILGLPRGEVPLYLIPVGKSAS